MLKRELCMTARNDKPNESANKKRKAEQGTEQVLSNSVEPFQKLYSEYASARSEESYCWE